MGRVFKTTYPVTGKDGTRKRVKSRKWYVSYRDADGILRRRAGYSDKEATLQLLAKLERDAARETEDMRDPFLEHRKRPLSEHMAEWAVSLRDGGATEKYVNLR